MSATSAIFTLRTDVGPGEVAADGVGAIFAQAGGAVASGSARFAPAKRCNHQVPAGKTTS
jgi:hypothetical protein